MTTTEVTWNVSGDKERNELRKIVVNKLIEEKPGAGKGDLTSKYIYFVEKLKDGKRIFLTRPVVLNKGFDFIIHVEDQIFINKKDNPRHEDILNDLKKKQSEDANKYEEFLQQIIDVCNCKDVDSILKDKEIIFKSGYSTEMILKVLKWLFIEQDIRYWNWSGRNMLLNGIKEINNS